MADVQLMLTGNVGDGMVNRLLAEATDRVGRGAHSLLVAISSPGGSVYWGVTAYNVLRGLGVEIITHNLGQVDSIGAAIYAAGDRRYSVSQGRFLIHSIQWNFAPHRASRRSSCATYSLRSSASDNIATILAERSGSAIEDIRNDMLQTRILDAQEAKTYGLVHEIRDEVFDPSQEIVNIGG